MAILTTVYDVESNIETTLYTSISPTATSGIILNTVLTITKGVLSFETNGALEYVSFGGTVVANGRTTLVDVRRNLTTTLNDFSQISATGLQHVAGITIVKLVDYHALFNLKAGTGQANIFTANQTLAGTVKLLLNDADSWIYDDGTDIKFKSSAQAEVSLSTLASAAGVNDKTKISVNDTTEGYLNDKLVGDTGIKKTIVDPAGNEILKLEIDLTDTDVFSATPSAGKVPLYGADESLPLQKALETEGVANEAITDKDVLTYASNGKVARADADAVGTTFPVAGVATAAAALLDDPISFVPMGSVVEINEIPLTEAINGVIANLTPTNTQQDTNPDDQNAAAKWRGQTFTADANPLENNITSVSLYLTKTGTPTAGSNATVSIYATAAGLPTGAALGSATLLNSEVNTGINKFVFASAVPISPSTVYAIVFITAGTSAGARYGWNYKNSDVYANGNGLTSANSGVSWTAETTYDRYFVMEYGTRTPGQPVFIDDVTGSVTLAVNAAGTNKYNQRIGYYVDSTHISLERGLRSIYATYTFTADAPATVDTEITIGFKPMLIIASARLHATNLTAGSMGIWLDGGASASLENKGSFMSNNGATQYFGYASRGLLYLDNDINAAGANNIYIALSVLKSTANTITIRRVVTEEGGFSLTPIIYLNIIGW